MRTRETGYPDHQGQDHENPSSGDDLTSGIPGGHGDQLQGYVSPYRYAGKNEAVTGLPSVQSSPLPQAQPALLPGVLLVVSPGPDAHL
jgi:hypothetical protein